MWLPWKCRECGCGTACRGKVCGRCIARGEQHEVQRASVLAGLLRKPPREPLGRTATRVVRIVVPDRTQDE